MRTLFRRVFGGKVREMSIKINSVKGILDKLNGEGKTSPWIEVPNYFSISGAALTTGQISITGTDTIAVKVFVNVSTGEIKTYVAKWIDDNANQLLP